MGSANQVPGEPVTYQSFYDPVRGYVCAHCGYEVPSPIPDKLGRIDATLARQAAEEMTNHIEKEHWLQNIPGTKETKND